MLIDESLDLQADIVPLLSTTTIPQGILLRMIARIKDMRAAIKARKQAVQHMIEAHKKAELSSLQSHTAQHRQVAPNGINWDVFISYSWTEKEAAKGIYNKLTQEGIKCWMVQLAQVHMTNHEMYKDERSMVSGEEIFGEIDKGITESQVVLSCVSDGYGKSTNCRREVALAAARHKIIIPARVAACNPYPPLGPMVVTNLRRASCSLSLVHSHTGRHPFWQESSMSTSQHLTLWQLTCRIL